EGVRATAAESGPTHPRRVLRNIAHAAHTTRAVEAASDIEVAAEHRQGVDGAVCATAGEGEPAHPWRVLLDIALATCVREVTPDIEVAAEHRQGIDLVV